MNADNITQKAILMSMLNKLDALSNNPVHGGKKEAETTEDVFGQMLADMMAKYSPEPSDQYSCGAEDCECDLDELEDAAYNDTEDDSLTFRAVIMRGDYAANEIAYDFTNDGFNNMQMWKWDADFILFLAKNEDDFSEEPFEMLKRILIDIVQEHDDLSVMFMDEKYLNNEVLAGMFTVGINDVSMECLALTER